MWVFTRSTEAHQDQTAAQSPVLTPEALQVCRGLAKVALTSAQVDLVLCKSSQHSTALALPDWSPPACTFTAGSSFRSFLLLAALCDDIVSRLTWISMACRLRKLMYRVVFPFELKLGNTSEACDAADSVYNLFAVVVHIGSGMNHGKV